MRRAAGGQRRRPPAAGIKAASATPKGSPIDFRSSRSIHRALRDPRSIESIESSGIPDRSSRSSPKGSPQGSAIDRVVRVDRALRDPRSIESIEPSGISDRSIRVNRALGDPRRKVEVGSRMRQPFRAPSLFDGFLRDQRGCLPGQTTSVRGQGGCVPGQTTCVLGQCLPLDIK